MKYFTYTEFDSPDEVGSGKKMHPDILEMLDRARDKYEKPMRITSLCKFLSSASMLSFSSTSCFTFVSRL